MQREVIVVAEINSYTEQGEVADRKKEVIDLCLKELISRGLAETTVRDLSASLQLQKAGIYYYFKDKDEAIIVCAEEAAHRLEANLIIPALQDIHDPDSMLEHLKSNADELAPTMKYFAQVCASPRYQVMVMPILSSISDQNKIYAERFAETLMCSLEKAELYFSIVSAAIYNYMIFGDECSLSAVMAIMKQKLDEMLEKQK